MTRSQAHTVCQMGRGAARPPRATFNPRSICVYSACASGEPRAGILTAMVGPLRVTRSVVVPERELKWRFSRSSGPGGQSVNTADSRVELSLDLTTTTALGPVQRTRALEALAGRLVEGVLTVTASENRSQLRNREAALERLAEILAAACRAAR